MLGEPGSIQAPTQEARADLRRQQRLYVATRGPWDEIPRRHLSFGRFGAVTDERHGTRYRINRGEVAEASRNIAGYYVDQAGEPVFLERAP